MSKTVEKAAEVTRIAHRLLARELTVEEKQNVSGGGDPKDDTGGMSTYEPPDPDSCGGSDVEWTDYGPA